MWMTVVSLCVHIMKSEMCAAQQAAVNDAHSMLSCNLVFAMMRTCPVAFLMCRSYKASAASPHA